MVYHTKRVLDLVALALLLNVLLQIGPFVHARMLDVSSASPAPYVVSVETGTNGDGGGGHTGG